MVVENRIKEYKDLDVWKVSHELVINIYMITKSFPENEQFGLVSQIRKSAYSIPANIAEGNGRQHLKEYIQFLYISKGSLNELKYLLLLAKDLEYLDENPFITLNKSINRIGVMLMRLINVLKNKCPIT